MFYLKGRDEGGFGETDDDDDDEKTGGAGEEEEWPADGRVRDFKGGGHLSASILLLRT